MNRLPRSIFGLSFASFSWLAATSPAATCYVDGTRGDDSRTPVQAQNIATPWRTLQKAANTMAAGDTAFIRAGTYRETVTPQSGQTFAAYENEKPLITACYQNRFGHEFNPSGPHGMPVTETTIAQRLKAAGYTTGLVGKWHLGAEPAM